MSGSQSIPFDTSPYQGWDEIVASWGWKEESPGRWRIEGVCPRCNHYMYKVYEIITIAELQIQPTSGIELAEMLEIELPATVYVRCNCSSIHEPNSSGDGCGQSAFIPFVSLN